MRDGRLDRPALRIATVCLAAAALVAALSSCGGDSSAATAKGATAHSQRLSRSDLARQRPQPGTADSRCSAQVGDFLTAMDRLRRNLVVGLSYEQYVGEMQTIRATYAAIPADRVALGCLRAAGTPGEHGLNQYIAASNAWTGCVETPGCDAATIEGQLQQRWRRASGFLSEAQDGLRHLGAS